MSQRETPVTRTGAPLTIGHHSEPGQNNPARTATATTHTRSADLPSILDAHAVESVVAMVEQGWEANVAGEAWVTWVEALAQAAADGAVAEVAWRVS